jgi:hypothetical protein
MDFNLFPSPELNRLANQERLAAFHTSNVTPDTGAPRSPHQRGKTYVKKSDLNLRDVCVVE